jgi:catechol 2,3-dioxygenase-like lactoylglutathione lyase family enzyme
VVALDHVVLTVADIDATCAWYGRLLGMRRTTFDRDRSALTFGTQKINLHLAGAELKPHARRPAPGTADLCFILTDPLEEVIELFEGEKVQIEHGPIVQTGALGASGSQPRLTIAPNRLGLRRRSGHHGGV